MAGQKQAMTRIAPAQEEAEDPLALLRGMARAEASRLAALDRLGLLDTAPEPAFEALVAAAAERFAAPIALVSLVDADRQWFKARVGLEVTETPRAVAFCNLTIRGEGAVVVPDARQDPRFADNPLVTGAPGIRFYAGAPVRAPDGSRIGSLCVIDRAARPGLSEEDRRALERLAAGVSAAIARRPAARGASDRG